MNTVPASVLILMLYLSCIHPPYQEVYKINFKNGIEDVKIKFQWNFYSLRAAIDAMLLLNETNGRTEVRLCKYFGKPFIAENLKTEYDTTTCRNKANIANTRNRKKDKK